MSANQLIVNYLFARENVKLQMGGELRVCVCVCAT